MRNSRWLPISECPLDQEGIYLVYSPDDIHGKPYISGNVTMMKVIEISNGFMRIIDGKFDFDTTEPTKFCRIDDIIEEVI